MSNFKPTWLYIKQHNVTGLKYFGKTNQSNVEQYRGSGLHWKRHLKTHGIDITTVWAELFTDEASIVEYALKFSADNDIVNSTDWANLVEENGLGNMGKKGINRGRQYKSPTGEIKQFAHGTQPQGWVEFSGPKGKRQYKSPTGDVKQFVHGTEPQGWVPFAASAGRRTYRSPAGEVKYFVHGEQPTDWVEYHTTANLEKIGCPYCDKTGVPHLMRRWHFNNCKNFV